jgi:hypothetical protein
MVNRDPAAEPGDTPGDALLMEDRENLGTCCCCGGTAGVRNIMMLPFRAPVPGKGWGCCVCHLPMDGAFYVACDRCLDRSAQPREVVSGYPKDGVRVSIDSLSSEPFEHRPGFHEQSD